MTATRIRRVCGVSVGLALATLFVAPAAAQPSINAKQIADLNSNLLYAAVPITVLVEGILIYTVYRFRNSDEAKPTQENRRLEITWTVATAIVLLFVGLASMQVLASPYIGGTTADTNSAEPVEGLSHNASGAYAPTEDNAVQVEVVARTFAWNFNYIDAGEDVSNSGTLVIPEDRPVYLHIISEDRLHSFHSKELGLKQDALPGQYNTIKTKVTEPGTYRIYCAEYCGSGHSQMLGTIEVKSQAEYDQWLDEQQSSGGSSNTSNATNNSSSNASAIAAPA